MNEAENCLVLPNAGAGDTYHPDEPLLVTIEQACRQLSLGRTKLFALCSEGRLDRKKLGRATRVTLASVRRLAASGTAALPIPANDNGEA